MEKEHKYYKGLSGLSDDKSLYDHQYAYFQSLTALGPKATLDDMKSKYYFDQTGLQNNEDAEYAYFAGLVGGDVSGKTISDLKRIVFNL